MPWGLFLEGPGNLLACKAVLILIPDGGLKGLENIQKKTICQRNKMDSLGCQKLLLYCFNDFQPIKLLGLWRNWLQILHQNHLQNSTKFTIDVFCIHCGTEVTFKALTI